MCDDVCWIPGSPIVARSIVNLGESRDSLFEVRSLKILSILFRVLLLCKGPDEGDGLDDGSGDDDDDDADQDDWFGHDMPRAKGLARPAPPQKRARQHLPSPPPPSQSMSFHNGFG